METRSRSSAIGSSNRRALFFWLSAIFSRATTCWFPPGQLWTFPPFILVQSTMLLLVLLRWLKVSFSPFLLFLFFVVIKICEPNQTKKQKKGSVWCSKELKEDFLWAWIWRTSLIPNCWMTSSFSNMLNVFSWSKSNQTNLPCWTFPE